MRCKHQFARNGQFSEFHIFAPQNAAPWKVPPGANAPPPSRRHWSNVHVGYTYKKKIIKNSQTSEVLNVGVGVFEKSHAVTFLSISIVSGSLIVQPAECGCRFMQRCLSTWTYSGTDFVQWDNPVAMLRSGSLSERSFVSVAHPGTCGSGMSSESHKYFTI